MATALCIGKGTEVHSRLVFPFMNNTDLFMNRANSKSRLLNSQNLPFRVPSPAPPPPTRHIVNSYLEPISTSNNNVVSTRRAFCKKAAAAAGPVWHTTRRSDFFAYVYETLCPVMLRPVARVWR